MESSMRESLKEKMAESFSEYDREITAGLVQEALRNQMPPLEIVEALSKGLRRIGDMFGEGQVFLPEIVMAASVMEASMGMLAPLLSDSKISTMFGRIVIGTVKGDIHDIGKNIVRSVLQANGFQVVDLGVDVSAEKFVEAVKRHKPDILAMSALLTITVNEMPRVIQELQENGMRGQLKVIIGGAPTTEGYARKIGADAWGSDANDAVTKVKMLLGINK